MLELEDLADEIFLEIFSHLLSPECARVCLLSRRLGSLAQYILYRTPSVVRLEYDSPSLELFLRTILARPLLAGFVRHLEFDGDSFWREQVLTPSDSALFTSAARRLELPYSMQRSDHQFQLLLHLLPNLKAIDITRDEADQFDQFVGNYVLHDRTRPLPVGFRSLRHVHFSWGMRVGLTPQMLMNLFRLPSIRTISVHIQSLFIPALCTTFSSPVTQLTLRSGSISILSLADILRIPRALTHLSLVDWDLAGSIFHGPTLGRVLQCVSSTLKHLQLSACDYMDMGPPLLDDWQPNTIGSLRYWPVLTTLRCSLTPLLGQGPETATARLVDVLPLGIRALEIEADQHWSCAAAWHQIADLVDQKDICELENLAVITVGIKLAGEAGLFTVRFSAAGVRLMVSSLWC